MSVSSEENIELTEFDLALVNALQISPRASWQRLAGIFEATPSTLSRRWQALVDSRRAWVTTAPGRHHLEVGASAFLLLGVEPGKLRQVMDALCEEQAFGTIAAVSGTHDLLIDCFVPTSEDLARILMSRDDLMTGITRREVLFTSGLHKDATSWRAGALAPASARRIAEHPDGNPSPTVRDAIDLALIDALAADGRASWAELAAACDISAPTARRRVEGLLNAGAFSLRCEAALSMRQGRREVTLLLDVPAGDLDAVGRWFGERADCRLSAEVIGTANLLATLWIGRLADLHEIEHEVAAMSPGARVVGREIELATVKRLGAFLDDQGRRTGRVPLTLVRQRRPHA